MSVTLSHIGNIYNKLGDHKQAISWCERSYDIAEELNILLELKTSCQCLYIANKALHYDEEALQYHERIMMLNDSLQTKETSRKLQTSITPRPIMLNTQISGSQIRMKPSDLSA